MYEAVLGFLCILAFSPTQGLETPRPIRIYVFTQPTPGGFVDDDSRRRDEAVDDIRRLLGRRRRGEPEVHAVVEASGADVTVEIVGSAFSRLSGKHLVAELRAGEYKKTFRAKQGMVSGAAGSLHVQLRRWIRANENMLLKP